MNCRAWEELLQRHLDGDPSSGLRRHLLGCPHCAASHQAIDRLLAGVAQLSSPASPPYLGDSLTRTLLAEAKQQQARRWRRRVFFAGFAAAAAALLLTIWAWRPLSRSPGENGKGETSVVQIESPADPAPPLRDSMARAGEAVAKLTNRTANDAVDRSRTLVPLMNGPAEPLTSVSTGPDPQLDKPLREAAGGVSNGLAPVAESARRAVGLFLRDLPMSRGDGATANDKPS